MQRARAIEFTQLGQLARDCDRARRQLAAQAGLQHPVVLQGLQLGPASPRKKRTIQEDHGQVLGGGLLVDAIRGEEQPQRGHLRRLDGEIHVQKRRATLPQQPAGHQARPRVVGAHGRTYAAAGVGQRAAAGGEDHEPPREHLLRGFGGDAKVGQRVARPRDIAPHAAGEPHTPHQLLAPPAVQVGRRHPRQPSVEEAAKLVGLSACKHVAHLDGALGGLRKSLGELHRERLVILRRVLADPYEETDGRIDDEDGTRIQRSALGGAGARALERDT